MHRQVIGIDIDPQSLEIASINAADMELDIDFIWCDINKLRWREQLFEIAMLELRFDVPQIYKFHKKKEVNIVVDLWRFVPYPTEGSADS
ncbi:hypothetical protein B296_00031390 [Ensete ventricosum]|uniref:Uncharacterized protein n=1 Tax=Ensete ventricosum TaxID=4639 RepID=A0A426YUC8_ENSVE|nr:hypothetical protein B296_00031390 [Ensete ventricosum]